MTNEDKPIDLATEVVKKINEDSRAPGTFRKHVFGTKVLTVEEYAADARTVKEGMTMSKQLPYPLPPEVANSIGAKGGITLRAWKNWCHRSIRQHKVHEKALIARMKEMSQALDDATAFR